MKEALAKLFSSAKVWTAILGMLATAGASLLARYGLELSTEAIQQIAITVAGFFGILLGAQGLADHGKAAAQLTAQSATEIAVAAPPQAANQTVVVQSPASGEINS